MQRTQWQLRMNVTRSLRAEDGGEHGVQLGAGLGLRADYAVFLFHSFQSASVASAIVSAD
jgi:hypothetical protein